jgi:RNA polymerase sigma-70 factor (ECF subfamily)
MRRHAEVGDARERGGGLAVGGVLIQNNTRTRILPRRLNLSPAGAFHSASPSFVRLRMPRFLPSSRATEDLPVAEARVGDPIAWAALLRRYQLPLYTYAQELLHHETAALDVVQDAFVAAHRHLASLREDARFGSWLFGIAHQKIVQHWRRSGREEPLDADALAATPDDDAPDPRDRMLRAEQGAALFALVDELPEAQRAVLVLHLLEDFSLNEIAAVTGAPLGTVKSRLHHARRALRERLLDPAASADPDVAAALSRPAPARP